jgi:hypothetical protein
VSGAVKIWPNANASRQKNKLTLPKHTHTLPKHKPLKPPELRVGCSALMASLNLTPLPSRMGQQLLPLLIAAQSQDQKQPQHRSNQEDLDRVRYHLEEDRGEVLEEWEGEEDTEDHI